MRAVAYIRVSDLSQVEGHSLNAQERLFRELCNSRGWEAVRVYREEGRSAHVDTIGKRPVFRQLLEDAAKNQFDVVVVHTLDRWSSNLKITIETISQLARHSVGLVSITENIDWSNPQGRLFTQMLGAFAEYYSGTLASHVSKGIGQRAQQGLHLGAIPFGYQSCWEEVKGQRQLICEPEHPGGIHPDPEEGQAIQELFSRYSTGTGTLSQLASWLNSQGFRTRNRHRLPDAHGNLTASPRLFTVASLRVVLHNPIYAGKIRHRDQLLPGAHEALISHELFKSVQAAMKRNSGRSETLKPHTEREYLMKGLIRCAYCGLPMWAQTYTNGRRYYREQKGSRGTGYCVGRSGSVLCNVPDEQMGRIVSAIVLPESWMDRVLAQVHGADEVQRVQQERGQVEQRLKRLGQVYLDGMIEQEDYKRQKRLLEERLAGLVVPGVDTAREAGRLLEELPRLWAEADLGERRKLLLGMLDAVYVDTVQEKSVVGVRPKPSFRPLFEIATTREDSGVVLVLENEVPPASDEPEAPTPCSWWRRGGVEPPVQKASSADMLQACSTL